MEVREAAQPIVPASAGEGRAGGGLYFHPPPHSQRMHHRGDCVSILPLTVNACTTGGTGEAARPIAPSAEVDRCRRLAAWARAVGTNARAVGTNASTSGGERWMVGDEHGTGRMQRHWRAHACRHTRKRTPTASEGGVWVTGGSGTGSGFCHAMAVGPNGRRAVDFAVEWRSGQRGAWHTRVSPPVRALGATPQAARARAHVASRLRRRTAKG